MRPYLPKLATLAQKTLYTPYFSVLSPKDNLFKEHMVQVYKIINRIDEVDTDLPN